MFLLYTRITECNWELHLVRLYVLECEIGTLVLKMGNIGVTQPCF